jgi:hypothetical protein
VAPLSNAPPPHHPPPDPARFRCITRTCVPKQTACSSRARPLLFLRPRAEGHFRQRVVDNIESVVIQCSCAAIGDSPRHGLSDWSHTNA